MKEQINKIYEIAKRSIPVGSPEMHELEDAYGAVKYPKEDKEVGSALFDFDNHKKILYKLVDRKFSTVPKFLRKSGIVSATYYYHRNNEDAKMTFETVLLWLETCGFELTLRKIK